MNKIFKRTIATLLTVAAFATVGPVKYTSLFTKEANAAETAEKATLKGLEVKKSSSGSELQLYDDKKCKSKNKVDFKEKDTKYYVNIKSGNKVYIDLDLESGYKYEISKGSKDYEKDEKITVSSSSTKLTVEVWKDGDKNNTSNKYTITVLRDRDKDDDDDDDDDDDKYDDIYLKNLEVDGDEVNLKESKTTYTVDVKESKTSVKIVAEPDEDDYKVRLTGNSIDSYRLDDDNDYEKKVTLNKGKNEFKINIKYDGDERTYTLIINRGSSSDKEDEKDEDKNNNSNNNTNVNARPNQWVTVNGNLMYNDSLGNPIKNSWFIDRNTGAWYYFQADGTTKKGWFYDKGNWYYLNQYSGQMQTGWSYINGQWYCLNSSGAMQTGWIKSDWSGDWYYCDGSGKMLRNTTVGGYRLASSGAWVR